MTRAPDLSGLSDRIRALVLAVVAHEADAATTDELADAAEELASVMEAAAAEPSPDDPGTRLHPITGSANAFAAPLVDEQVFGGEGAPGGEGASGGTVAASGTFTVTHEGPPGCVHGGAIAAGFEHVVERAETLAGLEPGPRTVTIHYRRPTLLGIPLRFEADPPAPDTYGSAAGSATGPATGMPTGAVSVSARLVQDGEVTCEARAVRVPGTGNPSDGNPSNGSG